MVRSLCSPVLRPVSRILGGGAARKFAVWHRADLVPQPVPIPPKLQRGLFTESHGMVGAQSVSQPKQVMSRRMLQTSACNLLEGIDLMVCDMAGTTVQEGGIVYKTLRESMQQHGIEVSEADIGPWHGAKKEAVIEHFAKRAGLSDADHEAKITDVSQTFEESIEKSYFSETAAIGLIDTNLKGYFKRLKDVGVKIGLDTGYPQNIQRGLVQKLGFDEVVDCYISSYDVREGRPFPYMIHQLMERAGVQDVRRVAKIGDSCRDMEMGRNAGCGLVVGVLSGADGAEALFAAGADMVCDIITDLPVPDARLA